MNSNSEQNPSLADQELRELIKQAQSGDPAAKEKVFLSILPTVNTLVKRYSGKGVPYDDLYQEACYGALIAMIYYDVKRPASFRTFAMHYIKKYIKDALFQQNTNLPGSYDRDFYYEIRKYMDGASRFKEEKGHEPTDSELSEYLDISIWRIQRLKMASYSFMTESSDIDSDSIAYSYSVDNVLRPVEEEVLNLFSADDLANTLTSREAEVLTRRCGFNDSEKPQTWAFISAAMGLSVPTVMLAYRKALAKVKRYFDPS